MAAHAVADDRDLGLAAVFAHPLDALGDEVEDVVLEAQPCVLGTRHAPVDHVDVEALLHQELDQALAGREVEDVGLRHSDMTSSTGTRYTSSACAW